MVKEFGKDNEWHRYDTGLKNNVQVTTVLKTIFAATTVEYKIPST